MNFAFSEEQEELRNSVRRFLEDKSPETEVRRLRLWCHPVWTSIVIALLGIFWIGRKLVGVI